MEHREASGCKVLEMGKDGERAIEIRGRDGSELFRFSMGRGPIQFEVDGLTIELQWDETAFAELFESLRRRA